MGTGQFNIRSSHPIFSEVIITDTVISFASYHNLRYYALIFLPLFAALFTLFRDICAFPGCAFIYLIVAVLSYKYIEQYLAQYNAALPLKGIVPAMIAAAWVKKRKIQPCHRDCNNHQYASEYE